MCTAAIYNFRKSAEIHRLQQAAQVGFPEQRVLSALSCCVEITFSEVS